MSRIVRWLLDSLRHIRTTDHLAADLAASFRGTR